jgi:L-threonylcarbamoyladenylate synthase
LLEKHYSPRAPLTLFEGPGAIETLLAAARAALSDGKTVGLLLARDDEAALAAVPMRDGKTHVVMLGSRDNLTEVAGGLYAALRELDRLDVDLILARAYPLTSGLGPAVADRLRRAAAGRVVGG